jgi:hypothetical protein
MSGDEEIKVRLDEGGVQVVEFQLGGLSGHID